AEWCYRSICLKTQALKGGHVLSWNVPMLTFFALSCRPRPILSLVARSTARATKLAVLRLGWRLKEPSRWVQGSWRSVRGRCVAFAQLDSFTAKKMHWRLARDKQLRPNLA